MTYSISQSKFLFWWVLLLLKMTPVKYDLGEVTGTYSGVSCYIQRTFLSARLVVYIVFVNVSIPQVSVLLFFPGGSSSRSRVW